jgi:DNA-binding NarL/FixJ family response regulator
MTMDIRIQGPRDGISAAIEIYERFGIRSAFVSAFGNPETAARAQAAHPLGWVAKPIRKADLATVLGTVARD